MNLQILQEAEDELKSPAQSHGDGVGAWVGEKRIIFEELFQPRINRIDTDMGKAGNVEGKQVLTD